MDTLTQMKCVACRKGEPTVTDAEIAELHPQVADWQLVEREGIKRLERVFKFENFVQALAFTNKVGEIAEAEGHHPDLHLEGYRNVAVEIYTHAIGGLSENDFILAAKIDEIPVRLKP